MLYLSIGLSFFSLFLYTKSSLFFSPRKDFFFSFLYPALIISLCHAFSQYFSIHRYFSLSIYYLYHSLLMLSRCYASIHFLKHIGYDDTVFLINYYCPLISLSLSLSFSLILSLSVSLCLSLSLSIFSLSLPFSLSLSLFLSL